MIKRLRRKFIWIAMGSFFTVMVVIIGAINGLNLYQVNRKADGLLQILSEGDGRFPDEPSKTPPPKREPGMGFQMNEETRFETRYFLVRVSGEGAISQIDTSHVAAVSSAQALEYAERALAAGRSGGLDGIYKYRVTQNETGSLLIFLDCRAQLQSASSLLLTSLLIGAASLAAVFLLVAFFSRRAVRPVMESMQKQQRFITDAGHELKTPLTIIAANTEVLALQNGPSEWLESIRNQTSRLDGLVRRLLTLAKMEEGGTALHFTVFSLSELALDAARPFVLMAQAQDKRFSVDIGQDISIRGDRGAIHELLTILFDNAVKYTEPGGEISLTLRHEGKSTRIVMENTSHGLPPGDLSKLFDRFYRPDESRDRDSGGYGIGLSVASAIAQAHKGKIVAYAQQNQVIFTVTL